MEDTIYILQTHTGTIPSKIVKFFTKYEYSHILISLDSSFEKMYSFGRKTLNNPLNGGFVIESINGKLFTKFKNTYCRIYKLNVTKKQYEVIKFEIDKFVKNKDIYKYDFLGIISRYFHRPITRKNYYVCSQFVAEVLKDANIHYFLVPHDQVKPKDFENINGAKIIYTGKLNEFLSKASV